MNKLSIAALAAAGAVVSLPAASQTLTTPLLGGNALSGIMFDIVTGSSALTLQSIGVDVSQAQSSYTFEVYTRPGTVVGHTTSSAGWTLLNTFSNVMGTNGTSLFGNGTLQLLDITDIGLAANSTYGLYVTSTVTNDSVVRYTNGVAVGTPVATDGRLTVLSGYGKAYAFGTEFSPRNFNGSLTYAVNNAVPEPATWGMMVLGFGATGFAMRRRQQVRVSYVA